MTRFYRMEILVLIYQFFANNALKSEKFFPQMKVKQWVSSS